MRVFNVPREFVYQAFTDSQYLGKWWGPKGFTNPFCQIDARSGGAISIQMRGPDGTFHPMVGIYLEMVPSERLSFTYSALDKDGKPLFMMLNNASFTLQGDRAVLTLRVLVVMEPAEPGYLTGLEEGWNQSLDRLAEVLAKG
jgi:uncharacterized protein YndB with AHSA1/START domain